MKTTRRLLLICFCLVAGCWLVAQTPSPPPDEFTVLMDSAGRLAEEDPLKSIELAERSLEIAEAEGDPDRQADCHTLIGNNYYFIGQLETATTHFFEAYRLNVERNDRKRMANTLNNLGAVYNSMEEWEKSIQKFNEALEAGGEDIGPKLRFSIHFNLASAYTELHDTLVAMSHYSEALAVAGENKDMENVGSVLLNLGVLNKDDGKYEEAEAYLQRAHHIADSADYLVLNLYTLVELGDFYRITGENEKALNYYEEGRILGAELQIRLLEMDAHSGMAEIYSTRKDWEKAFSALKEVSRLKDSLYNEEKETITRDLLVKYESEQKEQENVLLKKENQIQELLIFSVTASLVLLMAAGIFIYYRQRNRRKVEQLETARQEAALRQQMAELELTALRAQINPHFIFNCLNSIQNCIDAGNIPAAAEYLEKFSRLLRMMLEFSGRQHISLEEEIQYLRHYLDLEKLRFSHSFDYEILIGEEIEPGNLEIPALIVQPFVENAVKHGLTPLKGGGRLKICFDLDEEEALCVLVEDNGIGREQSRALQEKGGRKHKSMGMEITLDRLKKLHAGTAEPELVKITDLYDAGGKASGTRVEIRIPA